MFSEKFNENAPVYQDETIRPLDIVVTRDPEGNLQGNMEVMAFDTDGTKYYISPADSDETKPISRYSLEHLNRTTRSVQDWVLLGRELGFEIRPPEDLTEQSKLMTILEAQEYIFSKHRQDLSKVPRSNAVLETLANRHNKISGMGSEQKSPEQLIEQKNSLETGDTVIIVSDQQGNLSSVILGAKQGESFIIVSPYTKKPMLTISGEPLQITAENLKQWNITERPAGSWYTFFERLGLHPIAPQQGLEKNTLDVGIALNQLAPNWQNTTNQNSMEIITSLENLSFTRVARKQAT